MTGNAFDLVKAFDSDTSNKRQAETVPRPMMHLMEMIMKGDSSSGVDGTKRAATNITQLVSFNFLRHRRNNYFLTI